MAPNQRFKVVKQSVFIVFFLLVSGLIQAQVLGRTAYASSGSSASEDGFYLSYTIGQAAFTTYSDEEHALTEGFQQPLPYIRTGYDRFVDAFPNPVFTRLRVQISVKEVSDITIELLSVSGVRMMKTILKGIDSFVEHSIDFTGIPQGIYLLHVYSESDRNMDNLFKIEKL
ncbi:MAG: T9SS type A sorting domain-containing protein [Bacteroidales bacterium]